MTNTTVGDLIRTSENNYVDGSTQLSKYVSFSQYENIEKINAYLNSKHTSGEFDSLGREKPFFNICTSAVNIWYRATDIDRKDIRIKATKNKDVIGALLATIHLQDWMKRENFGAVLNEWGRSLSRYGSSVLKFVEKADGLKIKVVSWTNLISDIVDFENNPKIEKIYLTPAQLRQNKAYDQDVVEELISAVSTRKTMGGEKQDNLTDFIEVYELHGLLPLEYLTENEEEDTIYQQQMHVISYVAKDDNGDDYDDFCLLKGKEKQDPYMITHLIKEDGRSQSIGAVENLFESQWMQNHSIKAIKDQLDLSSKIVFQTSDGNFLGQNAITNIETGDILIHEANAPLTHLANNANDITSLQNFGVMWKQLGNEINGISDSMLGINPPSGTPYRQTEMLLQESHSLFELMTENKAIHIEEMLRTFIIPYLKKQMDTTDEIATTLEQNDITQIDAMWINAESTRRNNKHIIDSMLGIGGKTPMDAPKFDINAEKDKIKQELNQSGTQRFINPSSIPTKTWKEIFKDLEWDVEVVVVNESSDKNTVLTTLSTVLAIIADPMKSQVLKTPEGKMIFNKILSATGEISPLEMNINTSSNSQPVPQMANQQVPNGGNIAPLVGGNNNLQA